jgi:hypothetical protein
MNFSIRLFASFVALAAFSAQAADPLQARRGNR